MTGEMVDLVYECMMSSKRYAEQAKDMSRRIEEQLGQGSPDVEEIASRMTLGFIIMAEQLGMQRLCGLKDDVASNQVNVINKAMHAFFLEGDLRETDRQLKYLF